MCLSFGIPVEESLPSASGERYDFRGLLDLISIRLCQEEDKKQNDKNKKN